MGVNTMCEVDRLHIKHTIAVEDRVEGRLHYRLADTWSPWGSSDSPIMEKQTLASTNFLLPIITVIIMVVKSKKDKTKYDEEKANGATDESRKLNDSSEEKIING